MPKLRQARALVDALRPPDSHPSSATSRSVPLRGKPIEAQLQMLSPRNDANGGREVHAVAAEGVRGAGGTLPHVELIQASFGKHDVSGVNAHVGGPAHQASVAMGATAYAMGNHVAFSSPPDLHTAAHEAAHVVQQRSGVSLKGGVGQRGDRYETHADAVADAVTDGRSAEALLDQVAGSANSETTPQCQHAAVQGDKGLLDKAVDGAFDALGVRPDEAGRDVAERMAGSISAIRKALAKTIAKTSAFARLSWQGKMIRPMLQTVDRQLNASQDYYSRVTGLDLSGRHKALDELSGALRLYGLDFAAAPTSAGALETLQAALLMVREAGLLTGAPGTAALQDIVMNEWLTNASQELGLSIVSLDDAYDGVHTLLKYGSDAGKVMGDAANFIKLIQGGDAVLKNAWSARLSAAGGALGTAGKAASAFKKAHNLLYLAHAVYHIAQVDVAGDQHNAVKRFDALAKAAGAVGEDWLPTGLKEYASFVKELGAQSFFQAMGRQVNVDHITQDRLKDQEAADGSQRELRDLGVFR